ncbi:MAG: cytochrome c [Chitinophagales bacterium]|nr:cytochrome c [Chitinophagales bacterium]
MNNRQIKLIGLIFGVALFASCGKDPNSTGRSYMPDMVYPVTYETYSANPLFDNNQTARMPVAGTIPQGLLPANDTMDEASLKSYLYKRYFPDSPDGYEKAGAELLNPIVLSDEVLAQGQKTYEVFCAVCHGATGDGQGSIVVSGAYPPVPAYSERLKGLSEGKMFHSITYGRNLMGSYSAQVSAEDRWKVIYYIQKLSATGRFASAAATDSVAITAVK